MSSTKPKSRREKSSGNPPDKLRQSEESRRAALNLMEDAVQSREATDAVYAKLRETDERLQDAMKAAAMGSWWANLRTGLGTRDANLNQILGHAPVETTQPIDDCFRLTHPDDKEAAIAAWQTAVETKGLYETEFRIIRDDGTTRWLCEQGRFVGGENGTPDLVTGVTIDVTQRKLAEEALRESEERFRMVADNISQLAWTCDQLGNVTWYNQRWLDYTGLTFEEMRDWGWKKVHHPDHVERVVASVTHSRETGEIWEDTFPLRSASGEYRWFLSRAVPICGGNGQIVRWFGTNTDITDQKRAEEELQSAITREQAALAEARGANRVKDEFLAMVSHELRTPLNAIAGWARLLRSGKLKQKDIDRAVETIDRNANAQATIIDELLDISRIISGKLQIEQLPVSLVEVINAAAEVTRPAAEAKSIDVDLQLDAAAGPFTGDAVRLQQVVWNLLSNAIKFTPKHGRVAVKLARRGTHITIVVSDNGQGIDAAFLPHVFERFKQADSSEKRIHGGLGLGLSICRQLVEMHGGTVRADSKGQDQGATFTINFPIMALIPVKTILGSSVNDGTTIDRASDHETPSRKGMPVDALSGLRVLVVDDQGDARELLAFALRQYSAEVRACSSAKEALVQITDWKPDVIVSDIGLPGENGYELMEKIRRLEVGRGGGTPALALTGYASAADATKAIHAGYQFHLAKPVKLDDLVETVALLSGRSE